MPSIRRIFPRAVAIACLVPIVHAAGVPAAAGELRLNLEELARLLREPLGDAVRSFVAQGGDNARSPSGIGLDLWGGHYDLTMPAHSAHVAVQAAPHRLQVEVSLHAPQAPTDARPVQVPVELDCRRGLCPPRGAMPQIMWRSAALRLDLVPVADGGDIRLGVVGGRLGGRLVPACRGDDFLLGAVCGFLSVAFGTVLSGATDGPLPDWAMAAFEASRMRAAQRRAFRTALDTAGLGGVQVTQVTVDRTHVRVSFCLACRRR